MLLILLTWIVIAGISFSAGHFLTRILSHVFKTERIFSFPLLILSGFCFLSALTSWISIFTGIGNIVFLTIGALSVIWLLLNVRDIKAVYKNYRDEIRHVNPVF